ncbi:MAG: hypothetical protein HUJ42_03740 [Malacoplasma sp.]|nr:hypothetical protein [Malacoplasma sp.]
MLDQQTQQKENKKAIMIDDEINDVRGIAFITDDFEVIYELKKINRTFIKYAGKYEFKNGQNQVVQGHLLKFENMPLSLLNEISNCAEYLIENEHYKINESIKLILALFDKHKFQKTIREKLVGDIGEAIFILKAKKCGINADEMIRISDENLFDFVFNQTYVEVKSSTKNSNEIVVDNRQIVEADKKVFVISKFQILENKTNICQLYEMINSSNPILQNNYQSYKYMMENSEIDKHILLNTAIDLEKAECFLIDNNLMPRIKIEHEGGLKNIKIYVGITNCQKYGLEELKKYL